MMITTRDRTKASPPAHAAVPAGPQGQPVLGVMRKMLKDNLHFMMHVAREYGDIAHYRLVNMSIYQVNHPDGIKRILQDNHDNYSKATFKIQALDRLLGDGLVMTEGDSWLRQRRLMQPIFHRQHITALAEQMTELTLEMLERWNTKPTQEPFDVAAEMMQLTLNIATQTFFGARVDEGIDDIDRALKILMEDIDFRFTVPFYPPLQVPTPRNRRYIAALKTLDQTCYSIIGNRRQVLQRGGEAPNDLLTLLMMARDEETGEGMTDKQLRDEVMTLFLAGHETTAKLLTWCWYLLSKNPETLRRLHTELREVLGERLPAVNDLPLLPYTRMIIDEALRLYPPSWISSRKALADDTLCGYHVPAGTVVWFSPYVVHRHTGFWENPEGFDPERFKPERAEGRPRYAYIPFGGGGHQCIGKHFALMEAQLVLACVAQRYQLNLVPGHPVEPKAKVTLGPRHGLPMTLQPRSGF